MIDNIIKRLFINNNRRRRKLSIDSCEEVEVMDKTNLTEIVGHIVDCYDGYFTMVSTDYTNYELYIPANKRLLMPELNGFYQCKGTITSIDDKRIEFEVETIKKLERGSKELEEKIEHQDYQTAQKLIQQSSDVSSLFSSKFIDESLFNLPKAILNNPEEQEGTHNDLNETVETITDDIKSTELNETLKEDEGEYTPNSKENEPVLHQNNQNIPAIVTSFDKTKNFANLYPIGHNGPLIKISIKFLEAPVNIGQWYSIKLNDIKHLTNLSVCCNNFVKLLEGKPPVKTRISANGVVEFLTCAILSKQKINGFYCFKSINFPRIIDSLCLFNHLNDINLIKKVKFWCSLRTYPIANGIYFKIIKITKKFQKSILPYIEDERDIKLKEEEEKRRQELIKKKELEKQQFIKQQQILKEKLMKNENGIFEGFVCAEIVDKFLIYLPEEKDMAYLFKKDRKVEKLLGLWLQFQSRKIDGRRIVEKFVIIENRIFTLVSNNRVMFRTKIDVPTFNDSKNVERLLPFCRNFGIYLNDTHNLIMAKHYGRLINATIGCVARPEEPEENLIQWEILHIYEH